jgi:hypothetical protein
LIVGKDVRLYLTRINIRFWNRWSTATIRTGERIWKNIQPERREDTQSMSQNSAPPLRTGQNVFTVSGNPGQPCHCEARSAEAISCLTSRGTLVRQGIASALRASQ